MAIMNDEYQVKRPRMEFADNGLIVTWEVYSKRKDGIYDGFSFDCEKKLVYPFAQKAEALNKFISLGKEGGLIAEPEEDDED